MLRLFICLLQENLKLHEEVADDKNYKFIIFNAISEDKRMRILLIYRGA